MQTYGRFSSIYPYRLLPIFLHISHNISRYMVGVQLQKQANIVIYPVCSHNARPCSEVPTQPRTDSTVPSPNSLLAHATHYQAQSYLRKATLSSAKLRMGPKLKSATERPHRRLRCAERPASPEALMSDERARGKVRRSRRRGGQGDPGEGRADDGAGGEICLSDSRFA